MDSMENTTTCCCGDLPFLPEDVLIQKILVCLPVKSLLLFKSVCKSWRELIDTSFFIDLHTTTTTTFNSSSSSKFGSFIFHAAGNKMFMLSPDSVSVFGGGEEEEEEEEEEDIIVNDQADYLGFPPYSNDLGSRLHMVGSCNGLICIRELRHLWINHLPKRITIVSLWNPATRQFRNLPRPITIKQQGVKMLNRSPYDDFFAFGFDVKTKDYKVVQFSCFSKPPADQWGDKWFCRVQVYSLSTDSWRLLEGIHHLPALPYVRRYSPMPRNQGIYMNGCYFFVGKDESQVWLEGGGKAVVCNNSLMYSFDFTKEILTTMQLPNHDSRHDLILSYLGDKMALFMIQRNFLLCGGSEFHDCGLDYEYYDIWVLNDEQPGTGSDMVVNKESWTKLHSFQKINKSKQSTQPRCISNNGEFALISTESPRGSSELQLFNLVTKEAKKDFPFGYNVSWADVYTQSLVSIMGGNGAARSSSNSSR